MRRFEEFSAPARDKPSGGIPEGVNGQPIHYRRRSRDSGARNARLAQRSASLKTRRSERRSGPVPRQYQLHEYRTGRHAGQSPAGGVGALTSQVSPLRPACSSRAVGDAAEQPQVYGKVEGRTQQNDERQQRAPATAEARCNPATGLGRLHRRKTRTGGDRPRCVSPPSVRRTQGHGRVQDLKRSQRERKIINIAAQ